MEDDTDQRDIGLKCRILSDKIPSNQANQGSSGMSLKGLYLGVVLTTGNLLRVLFRDSSKRVIYEEVADTSLMRDLVDGIYIVRMQGNLRVEFELYYQLLSILRSPELLLQVTKHAG
ncbi:unnamed protein product, partial [Prorocentrum cordatum]